MKLQKLVVVSHTEHYLKSGEVFGWGATVEELNHLSDHWDEIVHIACLYDEQPPRSSRAYTSTKIRFVPLRPSGGSGPLAKLGILLNAPRTINAVRRELNNATDVQLRTPTGMGVYLLPAFRFLFRRHFTLWVKYAGDWSYTRPPLAYRFQRWWLSKNLSNCVVTINGNWPLQPVHCRSFANPCLDDLEIKAGIRAAEEKRFDGPFRYAFVGRLDDDKGVTDIIEALTGIPSERIGHVDFVGDGSERSEYIRRSSFLKGKVTFHGFLDRASVHEILARAHFILLPSKSEGFPKVIAEAACYGCIPIVSNVGSIGQYIDEENGFLWDRNGQESFGEVLRRAVQCDNRVLQGKSLALLKLAKKFTFDRYISQLREQVLNS